MIDSSQKNWVCIVAVASPQRYPHLLRHATALLKHYAKIKVLCVDAQGFETPDLDIEWISVAETMPSGVADFLKLMRGFQKRLFQLNPPIIEAFDPPGLIPAARFKKKFPQTQLIYMSMEHYTEQPHINQSRLKKFFWRFTERRAIALADRCATVSPGVAFHLSQLYGKNFHVIRNVPPYAGIAPKKFPINEKPTLLYHGQVDKERGVEALCAGIEGTGWKLKVIGGGKDLVELREKYPAVEFTGWLPYEESLRHFAKIDAGAIQIRDLSLNYRHSLPGKIFEYIQQGLAILVSDFPDMGAVVDQYKVGEKISQGPEGLKQALKALEDGFKENKYGKNLFEAQRELCWEKEREIFLNLFLVESAQ